MPVGVNVVLLAAGISTSWRRQKFAGLIPIIGAIGYYLIHAVARNSGGRYIVPYNWVGIFYLSIGLGQISHWAASKLRDRFDALNFASHSFTSPDPQPEVRNRFMLIGIAGIILLIGGIFPILENCIPVKFDQKTLDTKLKSIFQFEGNEISLREIDSLRTFTAQDGLILQGRALYPRHHKPYQMGSVWRIYQDRPYSHLDFYLSSPVDAGIILPMADPPGYFPHGVNVIIFACEEVEVYDALAVGLFSEEGNLVNVIWRSQIPEDLSCPMPPVDN
jgi:hypothetical protein